MQIVTLFYENQFKNHKLCEVYVFTALYAHLFLIMNDPQRVHDEYRQNHLHRQCSALLNLSFKQLRHFHFSSSTKPIPKLRRSSLLMHYMIHC